MGKAKMLESRQLISVLITVALSFIIMYSASNQLVYANEEVIASGIYNSVPWKITTNYELVIGEEGKTYTFDYKELTTSRIDYPWAAYSEQILSVKFDGQVYGNGDMNSLFMNCKNMKTVDLKGFNTSQVQSLRNMFFDCRSVSSIDLTPLDTECVISMDGMFYHCDCLKTLNLSQLDTSNVGRMDCMFELCDNLESLDVSNFDTGCVTNMSSMFSQCRKLQEIDLSNFDTSNVVDMGSMFSGCGKLTQLDLSNFNTESVRNMAYMFEGCGATNIDVSNFNTIRVDDMRSMFQRCLKLKALDLASFNTENVKFMDCMFFDCSNLTELDLSSFYTPNAKTMFSMFEGCYELSRLDISNFDTSKALNNTFYITVLEFNNLKELKLGHKSIFSKDYYEDEQYRHKWIREKDLVGETVDGPSIECLGDYTGEYPGWYKKDLCQGNHAWVMINSDEATCTEDGEEWYKCSVCQEEKTEIIPACHKWNSGYTVDKGATCTQEGIKSIHCSICNKVKENSTVVIPAIGHKETSIPAVPATCTENGLTEGIKCTSCGEILREQEKIEATGHKEEIIPAVPATCTENGFTEGIRCTSCSEILRQQKKIEAIGHKEIIIPAKAATCASAGLKEGVICSTCGEVLIPQETIARLEHTRETIPAVTASCTKAGKTMGERCSACGEVLVPQKTIPALGHKWDSGTVIKKAGSATNGKITYKCKRDMTHTFAKSIPKLALKVRPTKAKFTVKVKSVKKKATKIKRPIIVTGAKSAVTYKIVSKKKNFSIDGRTGMIKVRKGLKKGNYKVIVAVVTTGNAMYDPVSKKVKITIQVK